MIKIWGNSIPGFDTSIDQKEPSLKKYIIKGKELRPAIIVCPGGGYTFKAPHEGEPIAKWLNSIGINAFVLDYRVSPYRHPYPLLDLQRAVKFIRYNHDKFNIDPNRVGVLGFSAGGHLAGSLCVHFDYEGDYHKDEIDMVSAKPDMSVLCYPVINLTEYAHIGSKNSLLGEDANKELVEFMCLEKQVREDTPQTFIWTTAPDNSVPMENSLLYATALKKNKVPFEMHVFPEGGHGLGLRNDFPYVTRWAKLCEEWFIERKFL
ncbi:MAG: alpha/beta hydrolase [Clostridium sp.]|nr:alpha/beta hydrolase [Clostridium sp.]